MDEIKDTTLPDADDKSADKPPREKKKRNRLAIIFALLAAFFAISLLYVWTLGTEGDLFEPQVLSTPEAAVKYLSAGMVDNDMEAVIGAFAVKYLAREYNFTATGTRREDIPPLSLEAPTEFLFYQSLNEYALVGKYAKQVKAFAYSVLLDDPGLEARAFSSDDAEDKQEEAAAFIDGVDPSELSKLELRSIDAPQDAGSEKNIKNFERSAAGLGADETTERLALLRYDKKLYVLGCQLARYGDTWQIYALRSTLADTPSSGAAMPIESEQVYLDLIGK